MTAADAPALLGGIFGIGAFALATFAIAISMGATRARRDRGEE